MRQLLSAGRRRKPALLAAKKRRSFLSKQKRIMAPVTRTKIKSKNIRRIKPALKVKLGLPKEYIRDLLSLCQKVPEAVIEEDDDEISLNIKESSTPVLVTFRKRKRLTDGLITQMEAAKRGRFERIPIISVNFVSDDSCDLIADFKPIKRAASLSSIENEILEEIDRLDQNPFDITDEFEEDINMSLKNKSRQNTSSSFCLFLSDEEAC